MANNGWHIVQALRRNGVDAELVIDSTTFGMGLPIWEELTDSLDPYHVDLKTILETYDLPPWVKIWWSEGIRQNPFILANLFKMASQYDILHLHSHSSIYLQFAGKPYIIHEAGFIRTIVTADSSVEKLGRRSYAKADCVVWTNPDTHPLFRTLQCKRMEFVPFVVNPDKYSPMDVEKKEELTFFHPTRQVWDVKGNDKLLLAFAKFIKNGWRARLRLVDWGFDEDVKKAHDLIKKVNIQDHVEWVQPYTKPDLIRVYNECDAVFDQFILGSGGTVCYEAMSCGTPVVIYLNDWNVKCFGEMPPVVNAWTTDSIYEAMTRLTDQKYRNNIGKKEREFTIKHMHPDVIATSLINLYKEVYE